MATARLQQIFINYNVHKIPPLALLDVTRTACQNDHN